jgi:hypothetical protein
LMSYCLFCRSRTNAIWLDASLLIPWEGPYQVIQILSDLVYAIQLSNHTKPKIVHHDR